MSVDHRELLDVASAAADAAAAILGERFGRPAAGVTTKSSATDMVSEADRAAEAAILAVLTRERPMDGILGEEGTDRAGSTGVRWIVDPLDGTTNYLWGYPHWAVSVAAHDERGPLVGVVLDVCRGERYAAARGAGATRDGAPLVLAPPRMLDSALVATGFNYDAAERQRQGTVVQRIIPLVRDVRRAGACSLDLAWVADGRVDAYFERGVQAWDWAAGALLVSEAGGAWRAIDPSPPRPAGICAAHPDMLDAVVELFEGGA
ncbi:MAG: inositol monophosphatase family protein [Thermoleophilia bacterium]